MHNKLLLQGQALTGNKPDQRPDLLPYRQIIQGLAPWSTSLISIKNLNGALKRFRQTNGF
jgi:hypothetical protein